MKKLFSGFSLDILVGKWSLLGKTVICEKKSEIESQCTIDDGNGRKLLLWTISYNQDVERYNAGMVFIDTPKITYNGSYQLEFVPANDSSTLGGHDSFVVPTLSYNVQKLTFIEQGN